MNLNSQHFGVVLKKSIYIFSLLAFIFFDVIKVRAEQKKPNLGIENFPPVPLDQLQNDNLNQGLKELSRLNISNIEELSIEYRSTLFANILFVGQGRYFKKTLERILKKLILPSDSVRLDQYKLFVTASPYFDFSIDPKWNRIYFSLGSFSYIQNEDELAFILAHEIAHINQNHLALEKDSILTEKALEETYLYQRASHNQVEEIRCDFSAVERILRLGYNPWAGYNFFKRLSSREFFIRGFNLSDRTFAHHPVDEVRMGAIKGFIIEKSRTKDISEEVQRYKKFSHRIQFVKHFASIYSVFTRSLLVTGKIGVNLLPYYILVTLFYGDVLLPKFMFDLPIATSLSSIIGNVDLLKIIETNFFSGFISISSTIVVLYLSIKVGTFLSIRFLKNSHPEWYEKFLVGKNRLKEIDQLPLLKNSIFYNTQSGDINTKTLLKGIEESINSLNEVHSIIKDYYPDYVHSLIFSSLPSKIFKNILRMQKKLLRLLEIELEKLDRADDKILIWRELSTKLDAMPSKWIENKLSSQAKEIDTYLNNIQDSEEEFLFTRKEEEPLFRYRLRLKRINLEYVKKLNPLKQIELLEILIEEKLSDLVYDVLRENYSSLLNFVFSDSNKDKELPIRLLNIHRSFAYHMSIIDVIYKKRHRSMQMIILSILEGNKSIQEKIPILSYAMHPKMIYSFGNERKRIIQFYRDQVRTYFRNNFRSIREMTAFIESYLIPRNTFIEVFRDDFYTVIINHSFIKSEEDIKILLERDYLWKLAYESSYEDNIDLSSVEKILMSVQEVLAKEYPELFLYNLHAAMVYHRIILDKMRQFNILPDSFEESFNLWKELTSRGATRLSEEYLLEIYNDIANEEQKKQLESEALKGRVLTLELRDQFATRQVYASDKYLNLLSSSDREERLELLKSLIVYIQEIFIIKNERYFSLLEEISISIESTSEESQIISRARETYKGKMKQDLSLRILSEFINDALKTYYKSEQWELILFLRGDVNYFNFSWRFRGGKEIKKRYDSLPVAGKAFLLDIFLSSPKGLLPKIDFKEEGYAEKILTHLLEDFSDESKEVSKQILLSFIHSLEQSGNAPVQSSIFAYMLSLPKGDIKSIGSFLKNSLQLFGATGVKIGQFLGVSGLFSKSDSEILMQLQDQANIPDREAMYKDLRNELSNRKNFRIKKLLGAGSLKYAALVQDEKRERFVIKVMRKDAIAHTNMEFQQLDAMVEYLTKNYGKKYKILSAIVNASKIAVTKELNLKEEVQNTERAKKIYEKFSRTGYQIKVPEERLLTNRVSLGEFAEGQSFLELSKIDREKVAKEILKIEKDILLSDEEVIWFDPDRHFGNYRIVIEDEKNIKINLIDFGQLTKITKSEVQLVIEFFALSEILKEVGPTKWAVNQITTMLNLDNNLNKKLKDILTKFFPNRDMAPETSYIALISAIRDSGHDLSSIYIDYLRGLIQLNQYEQYIDGQNIKTPIQNLKEKVQLRANVLVEEMKRHLTNLERVRIGRLQGIHWFKMVFPSAKKPESLNKCHLKIGS